MPDHSPHQVPRRTDAKSGGPEAARVKTMLVVSGGTVHLRPGVPHYRRPRSARPSSPPKPSEAFCAELPRKVAVELGVATGTVQRIKAELGARQ
jgi:hypothetical protein